jgi:hypothetical protein
VNPDPLERGKPSDYFYATDATRPGFWLDTWGILRSYNSTRQDLKELYDNPYTENARIVNKKDFSGVCPRTATVKTFDVYAVLANDVLPNVIDVDGTAGPDIEIKPNTQVFDAGPDGVLVDDPLTPENEEADNILLGGDSDGDGKGDNAGGPLNPNGGTLVYNRRGTVVQGQGGVWTGGAGPLNDPTAMLYFLAEDLEVADPDDERCFEAAAENKKGKGKGGQDVLIDYNMALEGCPVKLREGAPVEPLVLRANAGDCIEVNLHNKLVDQAQYQVGVNVDDDKPVYEYVYTCEVDQVALQDVYDSEGNLISEGYYQCDSTQPYVALFDGDQASDDLDQGKLHALADGTLIQYMDEFGALAKNGDIEFDDRMPDLAGYQTMMWAVTRRLQDKGENNPETPPANPEETRFTFTDDEMYFFDNNLIRPSAYVGLHPQLVEYDITRDDGTVVGTNSPDTLAKPGGNVSYKWYAGDLYHEKTNRGINIVATPIEFGGSNLLSADRIKQPQKGMFGALAIEPPGATYPTALADLDDVPDGQGMGTATRKTRAQITITSEPDDAGSGGIFREALAIGHKIANLRWADGKAIKNVNQEEFGREGAEDSGQAGFNYGMEPSWFRFKLPPNVPSGNALQVPGYGSIPNVQAFYANELVKGEDNAVLANGTVSAAGDPATPVFRTTAGMPTRMHVLNGASADRDGTFVLHGHVWQRDPFVCTGAAQDDEVPLKGRCDPDVYAPSQRLGLNPQGKYMGGEEGMGHVYGHWPILFNAGGTNAIQGDYLFRDYAPNGNRNGMFGILRVE